MSVQLCHFSCSKTPHINDHVIIWMLMAVIAQLHLPNWYVCSLSFSLFLSLALSLSLSFSLSLSLSLSLSISQFICPPTFFLSTLFFSSVSLCLFLAAPGAMANHLIPNALLRPHGTNNPYNTLLGESAVYNNPLGMYNTQGVLASFHSFTLWLGQCFFNVWSWRSCEVAHVCSYPGTVSNFRTGELKVMDLH